MKGKWAEGIAPRHFRWVIKDRLAVCERPGGYGAHHRRVRRQEEILWIRHQEFTKVISLSPAPHNLHSYAELGVSALHRPFLESERLNERLTMIYRELYGYLEAGDRLLVHHEEFGDRLAGFVAGYLVWSKLVNPPHKAIAVVEQLVERQLGPVAREIVAITGELPPMEASPSPG